jgi:DOPA 4,5-dioxygenase
MSEREIKGYHAHIYYDRDTKDAAARVREGLGAGFRVQLGSWHDEPVGPHLKAMYQAVFSPEEFGKIVPWLMLHREGLSVLVHPRLGMAMEIIWNALWLGEKLKLNESVSGVLGCLRMLRLNVTKPMLGQRGDVGQLQ